jgi:hypothetical protein
MPGSASPRTAASAPASRTPSMAWADEAATSCARSRWVARTIQCVSTSARDSVNSSSYQAGDNTPAP